ncbi:flavodoxin family protein [Methanoculleus sp. FWC-SCC1]|uniref:Flavodoxin family protein n=1 Tax=Methanoculleus frigidifontis TaxID=2584085 RepID=A0ABT8MDS0_9EURY|nr:NAD(P)H-dependent oxidoreductase [Methanoculleus sp. FWC-SCC1]MDN7026041.1 flavodoxin family protein [Methanoculleus sp. FWC-SCC1]
MGILIVYYSWQGHTETVARELAGRIDGELEKIEPVSESGMFGKVMRAGLGMKAAIRPARTDLTDVDHLVIASPVWAQKVPPYITEYIAEVSNAAGKPFSVIVEMKGSGAENAIAIVRRKLEEKGMQYVSSAYTLEDDVEAGRIGEKIAEFAATIHRAAAAAPMP